MSSENAREKDNDRGEAEPAEEGNGDHEPVNEVAEAEQARRKVHAWPQADDLVSGQVRDVG